MNGLIFDLDGTLIDSAPDIQAAVNKMLAEEGISPLDLATVISFIGNGMPKLVERVLRAVQLPLEPRREVFTAGVPLDFYGARDGKLHANGAEFHIKGINWCASLSTAPIPPNHG